MRIVQKATRAVAAATLLLAMAGRSTPAMALAPIKLDDDKTFKVGFLLQPQFLFQQDGATREGAWSYDPFLRRARIIFAAKVTDRVHFFAETDNPNWGRDGDYSGSTFIQDAFVEFNVDPALQIDCGMLLAPFSHHGMQGAITLLGLDYHSSVIKYVPGSSMIWRDMGVMFRGALANDRIDYHVAVLNGVDSQSVDYGQEDGLSTDLNPGDLPRIVGRLTFNLFEADAGPGAGGFFYDGIYLKTEGNEIISPKKMLSFGVSLDWQQDAIITGGEAVDALAFAGDVFMDLPMGDGSRSLNGQADFYYYDHGEGSDTTGIGLLTEAGYRINQVEPILALEYFDVSGEGDEQAGDYLAVTGGVNWWYKGHNTNVKALVGASRTADGDSATDDAFGLHGLVQTQFFF